MKTTTYQAGPTHSVQNGRNGHVAVSVVDVCGKRTRDYLVECLSRFNRGVETVRLRAIGGNISKAVEVAHILQTHFGITSDAIDLNPVELYDLKRPCLTLSLRYDEPSGGRSKGERVHAEDLLEEGAFATYPLHHLLFDAILDSTSSLQVSTYDQSPLLSITREGSSLACEAFLDARQIEPLRNLAAAYYRSGMLLSPVWESVARHLSRFDDVILGLDTVMLHDAVISEQLLNALSLIDPREYVHTPNWLLLVIPSTVMHELEHAANVRDKRGFLMPSGRMGYRALQEILELDQSADLPGVSITIAGGAIPMLDTRAELRGLRQDFARFNQDENGYGHSGYRKLSSGDMIIRDQFKHFLRQIDFHKGVFFLTADKSNAALAKTEGLHSIYFKKPSPHSALGTVRPVKIEFTPGPDRMELAVPLGKLI